MKTIKATNIVTVSEFKLMLELMDMEYPDFTNNTLEKMAELISKEFGVVCAIETLEGFYSDN